MGPKDLPDASWPPGHHTYARLHPFALVIHLARTLAGVTLVSSLWASGGIAGADSTAVRADSVISTTPGDSAARRDSTEWTPPAKRPGIQDTVTVLPPVNVEGTRSVAPGRTAATTVRLTRAEVMRFLPPTVADALTTVPGVYLVKTGPWAASIFMRGLGGDRVVALMDGVRLNTVRGHGAQSSVIPVEWVQGVELLPGASSTLFGSDALAGVVNFVTHRNLFAPQAASGFSLSANAGQPGGLWTQHARLSFVSPRLGLELKGGLRTLDALHTPLGNVANSGDRGEDVTGRAAANWREAVLDIEHLHHAARDVGLPAFNSSSGSSGSYPLQGRDADRLELSFAGTTLLPEFRILAGQQTLSTDFTETTVASHYIRGNLVSTSTTVAADRVRTRVRGVQPSLRMRGFADLRLIGEYRRERARGPRVTDVTVRDRGGAVTSTSSEQGESVPSATRDVWAVGALAADTVLTVRLEAGVRYDALRSRADSSAASTTSRLDVRDRRVSAEGGLSRRLGVIVPYAHVASGFRVPNLDERYFNDDIHGGLRLYGNPDLASERSLLYEAGVRISDPTLEAFPSARVSVYRTDVDDLISFRYVDQVYGIPRFQYVNVRRARIEGIESEIKLRRQELSAALNTSFPRGTDLDTGKRLSDIGTFRASLDLALPVSRLLPQGRFATRLLWNGAVRGTGAVLARPAFFIVAVEATCVVAGIRGGLSVENVANQLYREPLSFIDSPGRTFTFSLRREFNVPFSSAEKGP